MKRRVIPLIAVLLPFGLVWLLSGTEALAALLFGFPAHLARVWPELTWNMDLLVPFAVASALAAVTGHLLLRGPMQRRGVRWRPDHTLCLAGFVLLLFATAFLVPGVLLHVDLLFKEL